MQSRALRGVQRLGCGSSGVGVQTDHCGFTVDRLCMGPSAVHEMAHLIHMPAIDEELRFFHLCPGNWAKGRLNNSSG